MLLVQLGLTLQRQLWAPSAWTQQVRAKATGAATQVGGSPGVFTLGIDATKAVFVLAFQAGHSLGMRKSRKGTFNI